MNRLLVGVVVAMTAALLAGCHSEIGDDLQELEYPLPNDLNVDDPGAESTLFDNGNRNGVENGGTSPTVVFQQNAMVTSIMDYHWNNGNGQAPGTIALRSSDGTTYGPWAVTTRPGQGGVPNAYWDAYPNIVIPAGTYTVIDSDPATWAQNAESGGKGMVIISGSLQ